MGLQQIYGFCHVLSTQWIRWQKTTKGRGPRTDTAKGVSPIKLAGGHRQFLIETLLFPSNPFAVNGMCMVFASRNRSIRSDTIWQSQKPAKEILVPWCTVVYILWGHPLGPSAAIGHGSRFPSRSPAMTMPYVHLLSAVPRHRSVSCHVLPQSDWGK